MDILPNVRVVRKEKRSPLLLLQSRSLLVGVPSRFQNMLQGLGGKGSGHTLCCQEHREMETLRLFNSVDNPSLLCHQKTSKVEVIAEGGNRNPPICWERAWAILLRRRRLRSSPIPLRGTRSGSQFELSVRREGDNARRSHFSRFENLLSLISLFDCSPFLPYRRGRGRIEAVPSRA